MSEVLLRAARDGRNDLLARVLERGGNIDSSHDDGVTPLMRAAEAGHRDTVALLLARGAAVDAMDRTGETALMSAAFRGQTGVVEVLLDHGALMTSQSGETALHRASAGGRRLGETALGAIADDWNRYDPDGHVDTIRLLLSRGADVNARDASGWTPLMYAMGAGHLAVIQLLLDVGANVDAMAADGTMAMDLAIEYNHQDVVVRLRRAIDRMNLTR